MYDMKPQMSAQQQQKPAQQKPQQTKFTVDDLKQIMGVLGQAVLNVPSSGPIPQFGPLDFPVAVQRLSGALANGMMGTPLSKVVIPPGNFNETMGYGEPAMNMNLRRIPNSEPTRVRVIPGQPAVVPPGYYE